MKPTAESNKLKCEHLLKVNNCKYDVLNDGTYFRVFVGRRLYSSKQGYIDVWPTTNKWFDIHDNLRGDTIESFVSHYKNVIKETKIENNDCIKYKRYFEEVSNMFYRLKVPNGYLIKLICSNLNTHTLTFIPDKNHTWDLEELPKNND